MPTASWISVTGGVSYTLTWDGATLTISLTASGQQIAALSGQVLAGQTGAAAAQQWLNSYAGRPAAAATLLFLPAATYGPAESHEYDTEFVSNQAIDITITALVGGTTPSVTLFIERQAEDGNWYPVISASGVTFSSGFPQVVSLDLGGFSLTASGPFNSAAQHNVTTARGRIRWTTTGAPTGVTLSASVIGRP